MVRPRTANAVAGRPRNPSDCRCEDLQCRSLHALGRINNAKRSRPAHSLTRLPSVDAGQSHRSDLWCVGSAKRPVAAMSTACAPGNRHRSARPERPPKGFEMMGIVATIGTLIGLPAASSRTTARVRIPNFRRSVATLLYIYCRTIWGWILQMFDPVCQNSALGPLNANVAIKCSPHTRFCAFLNRSRTARRFAASPACGP